jgi:hypothetical protein
MAFTNLPSKLSRAIAAYLVAAGAVPAERCFPIFTSRERPNDGPIVDVVPGVGQRSPALSGNFRFPINIIISGSAKRASHEGGNPNTAKDTARIAFDAQVGAVREALMQTETNTDLKATAEMINAAAYAKAVADAESNGDLDELTIMDWYEGVFGPGKSEDDRHDWVMVVQFEADVAETKLTGYT